MPVTLFNRRIQRLLGPPVSEGGLLLDAVLQEEVAHEAKKTAFPIELGADISDHLILLPGLYSMRGVVTDHPILWKATSYQHSDAKTRHLSAYAILRDLWVSRATFSITTGFLTIDNAALVAFKAVKVAGSANKFDFEAKVDEMPIVSTIEQPVDAASVSADAVGLVDEANGGTKVLQPVQDNRSALLTVTESIFGAP